MAASGDARSAILGRIRAANGAATDMEAAQAAWDSLPRGYQQGSKASREEILHLLEDRLVDYDAQVLRGSHADVPRLVAEVLASRGLHTLLVPEGFPEDLLPRAAGVSVVPDTGQNAAELDRLDAVLTLSTLAIAETGTIALQGVPGQGRRAVSLVPDVHVCLVREADVVATVPEAFARLQPTATLTLISGPSATADIEMTRIKGVHGPRFLHVVLLND